MMGETTKNDPVKAHRDGTTLCDGGKYAEALGKFLQAFELYWKKGDFFDSCYTLFKAAECSFLLKDYETAAERFLRAADKSSERGYDRLGLSALEYANDCYEAAGEEKSQKATDLRQRIAEAKKKLEAQAF
jgi:tetratricopeptide (TPR) repeat protein